MVFSGVVNCNEFYFGFTSWKCIHIFAGPTQVQPSQMVTGDYIARSGYVLIINNFPIAEDELTEKRVFAFDFGFTSREDVYLTTSDMLQALTDTAQRDFSNNDCFCCIIRSTGTEHGICGTDDKPIDIKTITSLFSSDKCPSLDGKPKIFVLGVSNLEYKLTLRMQETKGLPKDSKVSGLLRHLLISEKDFLVYNRFDEKAFERKRVHFTKSGWLQNISRGLHLMDAIEVAKSEQRQPLSLVSTLTKNVYFKRK